MEGRSLSYQTGEITSESLNSDNVAICHIVNSVSCNNFGLTMSLAEKYPYADIYGDRERLFNLNRAKISSRDQPGLVRVFKDTSKKCPFIICMVAHFGSGKPTDFEPSKQETIQTSSDVHYVRGLQKDNLEH